MNTKDYNKLDDDFDALLKKYDIDLDRSYSNFLPKGWLPLLEQTFIRLIEETNWNREVDQIKEKFGQLRIYLRGSWSEEQQKILNASEMLSATICDVCGKTGPDVKLRQVTFLVATRCLEHIQE